MTEAEAEAAEPEKVIPDSNLDEVLDTYEATVAAWLTAAKREAGAVQKLQKAVADGSLRDLEKLRLAARAASETTAARAEECAPLAFDAGAYLAPDGGFISELRDAATRAGVRLFERDGVIFSYPVLVRTDSELSSVRIDKQLITTIRPTVLAAQLKRLQAREPKARPDAFLETLFRAYELVRAQKRVIGYSDLPLTAIYEILTLLPGSGRDYTLLDFARDLYFLDSSGLTRTRRGFELSLPASTVSREKGTKIIRFVTRDGYEKDYAALKFTPPDEGDA